jgi:hypothetical protein
MSDTLIKIRNINDLIKAILAAYHYNYINNYINNESDLPC